MKKRKTDDLTFVKNGTKESKEFGEGKKPKTPKSFMIVCFICLCLVGF